jgi:hypothetical protein
MKSNGRLLVLTLALALAGCATGGASAASGASTSEPPTPTTDQPSPPRPAPAGTLAYILHGHVFVADQDGSNAVDITPHPEADCGATSEGSIWSPDGRYLAFRACPGVVVTDVKGNVVSTFPMEGWQIGWSPDSTRLAVWDHLFKTIGIYGVDGARQALLTMPDLWSPSGDHDPVWMPDGNSVRLDDLELPLDGSAPRAVTAGGGDPYRTYSPDGSLVAYDRYTACCPEHSTLMIAGSDGSDPREVLYGGAAGWDWGYAWSATGDRMALSSDGVKLLDVATGSVTPLTDRVHGTDILVIGFSPDGDKILFSKRVDLTASKVGKQSLWSIDVDGTDLRLLVRGTEDGEWSP